MPSTPAAEPLADAVWAFLERALEGLDPERDIPVSRELRRRIIDAWPVDEGWESARDQLARALAEQLAKRPQSWADALDIVDRYLDRVELDEPHPRQQDTNLRRRGQRVYVVEFGLPRALLGGLLAGSDPNQRALLYDALDEWRSWQTLAAALSTRPLTFDADEISTLLTRALRFVEGDTAAGMVLDPLLQGLRESTSNVDVLLEGWFERMNLEPKTVGLLALWRLPNHRDGAKLRQRLVHQLLRLPPEQGARIALHVAFRSWPAGAESEARRTALLECLEQLGSEGVLHALAALAYDRDATPEQSLSLFDAIVGYLDDAGERDAAIAAERAIVLHGITKKWLESGPIDVEAIVDRLPPAAAFPADENRSRALDWLLAELARQDPRLVRVYVLDWIEAHAASFLGQGLDQLLPLTHEQLPGVRWLVQACVSPRPALRHGALRCLLQSKTSPVFEDFAALDERQVLGLAHLILSEAALGAGLLDLMFALARSRVDCLEQLADLLKEPARRLFPGQYRRLVDSWNEALTDRTEDDSVRATVASMHARLDELQALAETKRGLASSIFGRTSSAHQPTMAVMARAINEEFEQSNSLWRMLATKIPIACGRASTFDFGDAEARNPTPLQTYSQGVEFSALDAYDPLAADYFRLMHGQRANQLLSPDGEMAH